MITLIQIIVLSLIQGLTEFLPVSSSAHLILGSYLLGWPDQGLAFDVATHLGTLLAAVIYFRRDLSRMAAAVLRPRSETRDARRLALLLIWASIPALLLGYLAADWIQVWLRDPRIIAVTTILFGILLWAADRWGGRSTDLTGIRLSQALAIGLAQVLALVPGTSRAGVTITAGRALGLERQAAARFSFLLAIPIIAAAGGYGAWQSYLGGASIDGGQFLLAVILSAGVALACIWGFLKFLDRVGLTPYVIYRLLLGALLIVFLF